MGDVLKSLLAGLVIGAIAAFALTQRRTFMEAGSTIHCALCGNTMIWSNGTTIRFYLPTQRGLNGWETLRICKQCMADQQMDVDPNYHGPPVITQNREDRDSLVRRLLGDE